MAPAKRRAKSQEEVIPDSIFDSLDPEAARKAAVKEPNIADLMAQLGELKGKVEAYSDIAQYRPALASEPTSQVTLPEQPKLDFSKMPDPVQYPDEYAAELTNRQFTYQAKLTTYNDAVKAANTPRPLGDIDALWNDFVEAHPEYAENDKRFRFALGETAKHMSARGIDFSKYIFQSTDQAFDAIMKEYDDTFGSPEAQDEGEEEAPLEAHPANLPEKRARRSREDDGDEGRTEGIMGGTERGSSIPGIQRVPAGDMIKDMQDMQRKSGYF